MVAIVVAVAAVFGSLALGFDDQLSAPSPYAAFEADWDPAGTGNGGVPYVNVTHTNGEVAEGSDLYVVDDEGNRVAWETVWTGGETVEATEYVHIDGKGSDCALVEPREGTTYRLVHESGDTEQVLETYTVPTAPDSTPGPFTC